MKRQSSVLFAWLLLALAACTAANVPSALLPNARTQARHPEPNATLGGVVNEETFSVPAGKAFTVRENLYVFASKSATVDGALIVYPGVTVAFITPSFTLGKTALLRWETFPAAGNAPSPMPNVVSACNVFVAGDAQWIPGGGVNLELSASGKPPEGQHCLVVFQSGVKLALEHGLNGSHYADGNGGNGGSIEIGSTKAIEDADAIAKAHGHSDISASRPDTLNLGISLIAAPGGTGKSVSKVPARKGTTYSVIAGTGGKGGKIDVTVGKIVGNDVRVQAGSGGDGGYVYEERIGWKLDGTASSPDASDIEVTMGAGGEGGDISVTTKKPKPKSFVETPGDGGNASTLVLDGVEGQFAAGAGYSVLSKTPLTTGHGGSATINLALGGERGTNGKKGQIPSIEFFGGTGGNTPPAYLYGVAPGTLVKGGDGGSLTLVLPKGSNAKDVVKTWGLKVTIGGFGSGGSSWLAPVQGGFCPTPPPAGVDGGNAGAWHDNGLFEAMYPNGGTAWGTGFAGGNGSAGTPPGNGGTGGKTDGGFALGAAGAQGKQC
ncbi:MAG: hypothetical protein JO029_12140 [Candidatus Eremiobacteraeota bacterium]|nr:hypothetical protein [Candidatus Eremiobacteraeota bacterium]